MNTLKPSINPTVKLKQLKAQTKRFALLLLAIITATVIPEVAMATGAGGTADDVMGKAVGYFQQFMKMILYAFEGLVFVAGAWWIIKSVSDWKQGERGSGIGDIVITVFVAVAVIGIVFVLATKGIAIIETNVKMGAPVGNP